MVYKGGYFNFAVYQNTINVEWCAGNESSAFGNRAAIRVMNKLIESK